jgi:hypothetical protein
MIPDGSRARVNGVGGYVEVLHDGARAERPETPPPGRGEDGVAPPAPQSNLVAGAFSGAVSWCPRAT